jgi:hypothetical protein
LATGFRGVVFFDAALVRGAGETFFGGFVWSIVIPFLAGGRSRSPTGEAMFLADGIGVQPCHLSDNANHHRRVHATARVVDYSISG